MWVESAWGQGSTFFFSLPALSAARAPGEDPRPLLMVVEDDPGVGAFVRILLERSDYRTRVVETAEAALRVVGELQPAAILLDLGLPGMSGAELLRRLRQRSDTRRTPVVALTGAGEDAGLELAEIIGWVEKPIDQETLLSAVRWALAPRQEHYHLLLVEDNADVARVIVETMRQRGLDSAHARNGREAIELSRRISYDLLLLDPGLPDVDGFGVVDWLRRHNRHRNVPVVVYSARELDDSERDRLRLGPTEFIVKTRVAPEELEQRVVSRIDEMIAAGQSRRS
jgi:CheY-like chemotaxis protein